MATKNAFETYLDQVQKRRLDEENVEFPSVRKSKTPPPAHFERDLPGGRLQTAFESELADQGGRNTRTPFADISTVSGAVPPPMAVNLKVDNDEGSVGSPDDENRASMADLLQQILDAQTTTPTGNINVSTSPSELFKSSGADAFERFDRGTDAPGSGGIDVEDIQKRSNKPAVERQSTFPLDDIQVDTGQFGNNRMDTPDPISGGNPQASVEGDFDTFLGQSGQRTQTGAITTDSPGNVPGFVPGQRTDTGVTQRTAGDANANFGAAYGDIQEQERQATGQITADRPGDVTQFSRTASTATEMEQRNASPEDSDFQSSLSDIGAGGPGVSPGGATLSDTGTVAGFDQFLDETSLGFTQQGVDNMIQESDAEIDALFEQQARELGRQFALTPDAQSGQAMNMFERLRSDATQAKLKRRQELRQRHEDIAREENRLNTQAMQRADEFAANLGMTRDQFIEQARQFGAGVKLENQQVAEAARQFNAQLAQQRVESGRTFGLESAKAVEQARQFDVQQQQAADTFAAQHGLSRDQFMQAVEQFNAGQNLQNRQLEESVRQFNASLAQQRVEAGRDFELRSEGAVEQARQFDAQMQQAADIFAAEHGLSREQFLQAVEQFNAGQNLADKQLEESARQFNAEMAQQRVDSAKNFGLEEARMQELARQFDEEINLTASNFAAQHNLNADQFLASVEQFNAGQALANRELEESVIQFNTEMQQRRQEMIVQADQESARLSEMGRQFDITADQRADEYAADHNLNRDQFKAAVDQFNAGQDLQNRELEESIRQYNNDLAFRRTELSQQYAFEQSRLGEQARQFDANFTEQSRQFNANYGASMQEFAEGQYRFNANLSQQMVEFSETMGLSRDQFNEARRQFDANDANRDQELDEQFRQFNQRLRVEEDQFAANLGMTREQFVEAKRQFNENMGLKEDELWGGSQPLNWGNLETMSLDLTEAKGKKFGEEGYNSDYDLDGDGVITNKDTQALALATVVNPDGSLTYQPPGRTLAAQQADNEYRIAAGRLGLDNDVFEENKLQFDDQLKNHVREFESNFAGVLYGVGTTTGAGPAMEKTMPVDIYDPVTGNVVGTEYVTRPVSALERDQFNEAKRQFDERMEVDIQQFFAELGLTEDELSAMRENNRWDHIVTLAGAIMQSYSTIRSSGNNVFSGGGGKTNAAGGGFNPSQIPFGGPDIMVDATNKVPGKLF